ncbi:HAMP domain-containing sensor histidine kinase [Shimazuella kribbensis]|uniref:HAMP domain-containing sensor histidine kinase n=1 Tax=Shimazuella kribbensis TaxID=139808 RepID=UPI00042A3EB7|nr:HAMP domain-containing sensor histidine kinase [Shimazuella kribbensis]
MKFRDSLLFRYLFIILIAIIWPILFPIYYGTDMYLNQDKYKYNHTDEMKTMWNRLANNLNHATAMQVNNELHKIKARYPKANMFWIDGSGQIKFMLPKEKNISDPWSFQKGMQFIQKYGGEVSFTIVAPIGGDPKQGYLFFWLPYSLTDGDDQDVSFVIFVIAAFVSYLVFIGLFFFRIRHRLILLQVSMTQTTKSGVPSIIKVKKKDEIGALELAFNHMIHELEKSQQQKKEEETLRRELLASISHDLRTPLAIIQGHSYALQRGDLSDHERKSLLVIDSKVDDLSQLIENLLSYTLLTAGKYPMQMQEMDVTHTLRTVLAQWYPLFETKDFQIDIDLLSRKEIWFVDPLWFKRILDNLFQNVLRHASSGKYVGIQMQHTSERKVILIEDKGPGLDHRSTERGVGIGLSIVKLMMKEMDLQWEVETSSQGTRIYLIYSMK